MQIRCLQYLYAISFVNIIILFMSVPVAISSDTEYERPELIYDPLFGIEYRLSEIHFDRAPSIVYKCNDLRNPHRELFLFGKTSKGKFKFYYVYGLIEMGYSDPKKNVKHLEAEGDDGIIVIISPDGCRDIGAGYAWSTDKSFRHKAEKYGVSDDVVSELLSDAVDREVKAFGGKKEFFRRLRASGVDESSLPWQLRDKLSNLRQQTDFNSHEK